MRIAVIDHKSRACRSTASAQYRRTRGFRLRAQRAIESDPLERVAAFTRGSFERNATARHVNSIVLLRFLQCFGIWHRDSVPWTCVAQDAHKNFYRTVLWLTTVPARADECSETIA